jgi:hypothetical protein
MPLGTVKTHARRGMLKIKQILADQGLDIRAASEADASRLDEPSP